MSDDGFPLEGSLRELIETPSLKWIFVGGKGGVGKTTTSCAIATKLAETRESVLLLSTDPAHNLSDALTQKFTSTPTLVNGYKNLYAMEIDSRPQEAADFQLFKGKESKDLMQFLPELINAVPGIDEALSFAELMQSVQTMRYSTIVFDTAPTGHTLRLLGFPRVLEKGLKKIGELAEGLGAALDVFTSLASTQPTNPQELTNKIHHLRAVTTSVREAFQDATHTTFVCVCIPEFLSLFETERLVQELAKQGIDCSNIVVNQVLMPIGDCDGKGAPLASPALMETLQQQQQPPLSPQQLLQPAAARGDKETPEEEATRLRNLVLQLQHRLLLVEQSYAARRRMQSKYLLQIKELYTYDFHVACVGQQSDEIRGVEKLKALGNLLCKETEIPILL